MMYTTIDLKNSVKLINVYVLFDRIAYINKLEMLLFYQI